MADYERCSQSGLGRLNLGLGDLPQVDPETGVPCNIKVLYVSKDRGSSACTWLAGRMIEREQAMQDIAYSLVGQLHISGGSTIIDPGTTCINRSDSFDQCLLEAVRIRTTNDAFTDYAARRVYIVTWLTDLFTAACDIGHIQKDIASTGRDPDTPYIAGFACPYLIRPVAIFPLSRAVTTQVG